MKLDLEDFYDEVEESLEEAIAEGVEFGRKELIRRIPSQRVETRKAVKSRSEGLSGFIAVEFPSNRRYQARGTETEKIVKRAWYSIEKIAFRVIEQSFRQKIEE